MSACKYCGAAISWSRASGRPEPLEEDGALHRCLSRRSRRDPMEVFDAVWSEAYERGFAEGQAAAVLALEPAIDHTLVMTLVRFCHPDRNPGRWEEANRITAELLKIRDRLRAPARAAS